MRARLRAFYFLYYGYVGAYLSFFAPYLRGLGFTGAQIGAALTVSQIASALSALAWGGLADRLGAPARALRIASFCGAASFAALPFARTPFTVAMVLGLSSLFLGACVPLCDSVAVESARQGAQSYARTRLFGSIGFIVVAQGAGAWLTARGDMAADRLVPIASLACIAGTAFVAQGLPDLPARGERAHLRDAAGLLRSAPLFFILLLCTVHWASCAPYHLLFGVLVRDRGLPASLTGLAMALGVLAEVFALLAFPPLARRFSLRTLFCAAFAATALRWLLVSRAQSPTALVLLQLLHGATFGLFWGSAIEAMARAVPGRLRASGQAIFSAVVFGAGNATAYWLAGVGYDRFGSVEPLFALAAAVELAPLALAVLLGARLLPGADATPARA